MKHVDLFQEKRRIESWRGSRERSKQAGSEDTETMTTETDLASVTDRTMGLAHKIAADHAIKSDFRSSDALVDVGLSSLDLVNLMVAIEAEFDIMIPAASLSPKNFFSIDTISRLIELVLVGAV